jgi:hypothetical protein
MEEKTEKVEFDNSNEAGAIWIRVKDGKPILSIVINGEQYSGFKNDPKRSENAPDYDIVQYSEAGRKAVGAGWIGETKNKNEKLNIKLNGETPVYYTAVRRSGEATGKAADFTIFVPTPAQVLETETADAEATAEAPAAEAPAAKKHKSI